MERRSTDIEQGGTSDPHQVQESRSSYNICTHPDDQSAKSWGVYTTVLSLAYQSLGVVYGDLSTSPLYVYKCTFSFHPKLLASHHSPANSVSEEEILGVLSFIFWTLTLIPLLKYVFLVLNVNDNGEGGSFALYSLLCRHAKLSLLPNQQQVDEQVSTYKVENSKANTTRAHVNDRITALILTFFESNYHARVGLLLLVLLGTCMLIGDGVVTPSISVLSAVSGINTSFADKQCFQVLITCIILVSLFSLQQYGTHRVAFLFAPIVTLWLLTISSVGVYNVIKWNPSILIALSPYYMYKYITFTGYQGWLSFGGIVLCLTGSEAMFANLGHFSATSIKIAFAGGVYPCLVLSYMGQAAFLAKNQQHIQQSFFKSIPESIYWPVVIVATLASVVASQSVISATFSIVNQCRAMGCFPHVKVIHTSTSDIKGQIYIPEINWMLMLLSLSVTLGFKDTSIIGNAYGLAVTSVMLVTTFLMSLVLVIVWRKHIFYALSLLLIFGTAEGLYFSASLVKVPRGGWVPVVLALIFMAVMCIWHYGTTQKYEFEMQNKVSMKQILSLGPSLGMVRVPGIGLVYSNLVTGIPSVFSHFVTNIPAFHRVLVFVCIKAVPVPRVPWKERFLVGRIGPKVYRMFRCIVRYGYKDVQDESQSFEEMLVDSIEQFVRREKAETRMTSSCSTGGEQDAIGTNDETAGGYIGLEAVLTNLRHNMARSEGSNLSYHEPSESTSEYSGDGIISCSNLQKPVCDSCGPESSDSEEKLAEDSELWELKEAKDAGVAYVLGRSIVKASQSSSLLKRVVINHAFSFLKENCRSPALALHVPHPCLIRVGMVCYV